MEKLKIIYIGSRENGIGCERELARLLAKLLGCPVERDIGQSRGGGACLLLTGLYAIQVAPQQDDLSLSDEWQQAVAGAVRHGLRPALAYRQNRNHWQVMIRLLDLSPALSGGERATLSLAGFAQVAQWMLTWIEKC